MLKQIKELKNTLKRKLNRSAITMFMGKEIDAKAYYVCYEKHGKHWPVDLMPIKEWSVARKKAKKMNASFVLGATLLLQHAQTRKEVAEAKRIREEQKMKEIANVAG